LRRQAGSAAERLGYGELSERPLAGGSISLGEKLERGTVAVERPDIDIGVTGAHAEDLAACRDRVPTYSS